VIASAERTLATASTSSSNASGRRAAAPRGGPKW